MAAITKQKLKEILESAYEAGYHGSLDMKESYAEETVTALAENRDAPQVGWKVYKARDLRTLNVGTVIEHQTLGKGIVQSSGTERFVKFDNGKTAHFFDDGKPWDMPIKVVG